MLVEKWERHRAQEGDQSGLMDLESEAAEGCFAEVIYKTLKIAQLGHLHIVIRLESEPSEHLLQEVWAWDDETTAGCHFSEEEEFAVHLQTSHSQLEI